MVVLPTSSGKSIFFKALSALQNIWQCIHPSLYCSRTKELLVPTIIRSFYNFASPEQAVSLEFTDLLDKFALAVVDEYHFIDSQNG